MLKIDSQIVRITILQKWEYISTNRRVKKRSEKEVLKTYSICGSIHDINKQCRRKTTHPNTGETKFRKTNKWTQKSRIIRARDNNLCRVCLTEKYGTIYKYNYTDLEVHHIIPIAEEYEKRLDSDNLITLCRYHHELAESGKITREELFSLIPRE